MTNRSLVLLSGEKTSLPLAEAKALFLAYDPATRFETPEPRVLIAESEADPSRVASRIAYARRVGVLITRASEAAETVKGKRVSFRAFRLSGAESGQTAERVLRGVSAQVDLENPDYEFTLVEGRETYLSLTAPRTMRQDWSHRRPRGRAFFYPSAIFPKMSRALFNLTRCREGDVFLDPFAGTGSIPIEAAEAGAEVVAIDLDRKMTRGALANMKKLHQVWLGVVRADSFQIPMTKVDAVATDVPYGRASSTRGRSASSVVDQTLASIPDLLRQGARLVLMHPRDVPIPQTDKMAIEEEHHLYVHKRLTRTISILKRR